ncbi:hypothetical protein A9Q83_01380 [Alphaproteobacteria bacterium 46_93_T64]|nr:hypothetical protein A9Q83_01380 [Alphaproteobacteria bacterium 46_93_T64]
MFGLFKPSREKVANKYKEMFEPVPIFAAVYGFFLKESQNEKAKEFKRNYDTWRHLALSLIDEGDWRNEAASYMDDIFNKMMNYPDLIAKIDDVQAEKSFKIIIKNIEVLHEILN